MFQASRVVVGAWLAVAALASAFPGGAAGQTIRGEVVDAAARPAGAVLVRLLRVDGRAVAATLSDSAGRFVLRAPRPGTYVLRSERIGFRTVESDKLAVGSRGLSVGRIEMPTLAVELPAITVKGEARCRIGLQPGAAAAALWEEVRKALLLTDLSRRERRIGYELRHFQRRLSNDGILLRGNESVSRGVAEAPFVSLGPSLLTDGFAQSHDGQWRYYGPDAALLASDAFLDTHCLRPVKDPDSAFLALEFEPVPGRQVPDIRGVVRIDRHTKELRSITFHYTGPDQVTAGSSGGEMEFARDSTGFWFIREWMLRAAVIQYGAPQISGSNPGVRWQAVGVEESGGEVLRTFAPGAAQEMRQPRK